MKQLETKLNNGLRVITSEAPHAGSVTVSIFVGAGGRYEDLDKEYGVSHFLEHLPFKGSAKRPTAKQIAEEIDGVGGIMNAYTSEDHTCYYVKLPSEHFALAFDVVADMVTAPLFEAEQVERERNVILEEIKMYKDDPARLVYDLVGDLLWPTDELRTNVIGTEQSISSIDRGAIVDYYKSLYATNNIVISVAGDIRHDEVVEKAKQYFDDFTAKTSRGFKPTKGDIASKISNIVLQDTNQTHLIIAVRAPELESDDDMPVRLLAAILGGSMSSRLFLNVREQKGLAYSVHASSHAFADSGKIEIYAGVNRDKITQALEAIREEIDRIREEKVSQKELDRVKEQFRGRLIMSQENNATVADTMGTQLILTGKKRTLEQVLREIDEVTTEQIAAVAKKYLTVPSLRLAMIGNYKEADVAKFENIVSKR